jgi:hypothetical protein
MVGLEVYGTILRISGIYKGKMASRDYIDELKGTYSS